MGTGGRLAAAVCAAALMASGCSQDGQARPQHVDDCTSLPPSSSASASATGLLTSLPPPRPIRPVSAYPKVRATLELEGLEWAEPARTKVVRVGPFHVVGDASERNLKRIASDLRHGTPIATQFTENPFVDTLPILVLAPRTHDDYVWLAGEDLDYSDGSVFTWASSPIMALSPYAATEGPEWRKAVTTHELVHLAGPVNDLLPFWLTEGYAEMGTELSDPSMRDINDEVAAESDGGLPQELPEGAEAIDTAYAVSGSFVRYLCGLKGRDTLVEFYEDSLALPEDVPGQAKEHYGKGLKTLKRDWRSTLDRPADASST